MICDVTSLSGIFSVLAKFGWQFIEQQKTFVNHFKDFLNMSQKEQMLQLKGTLLSVKDFWAYHLGSSAVHVILAVNE